MTKDLILLERGEDELLLAHSFHLRPLYVERGRERVKRLLAAAGGRTADELRAAFPTDAELIRLLADHRILPGGPAPAADEAPARGKGRITLYLLLGESCNMACSYCLNGSGTYRRDDPAGMSAETAFRGVKRCLDEAVPGGIVEVAFFGGEPLLHWPLVKETIRHCEEVLKPAHPDRRIRYHLTSNLTIRPPDLVEWVTRYDVSIVCGVDGPPEIQDRCRTLRGGGPSHARTAETVRQLTQAGARVTLRATITSANHDRLAEVAEHHARLGAASSLFIPVRPVNSDQESVPESLLPDPDRVVAAALDLGRAGRNLFPFNDFSAEIRPGVRRTVACGAPRGTTYVVRPDGDIYPCIYMVGRPEYRLGNVAGTLDRRPLDGMMKTMHVDNREECRTCVWRYACGGGCPVMNLSRAAGAPGVAEYSRRITCDVSRALLADSLWRLADRTRAR